METQQYVCIDLHRSPSVIVRKGAGGEALETVQIDNDPLTLAATWWPRTAEVAPNLSTSQSSMLSAPASTAAMSVIAFAPAFA